MGYRSIDELVVAAPMADVGAMHETGAIYVYSGGAHFPAGAIFPAEDGASYVSQV